MTLTHVKNLIRKVYTEHFTLIMFGLNSNPIQNTKIDGSFNKILHLQKETYHLDEIII